MTASVTGRTVLAANWPMADLDRTRDAARRAGLDVLVAVTLQNFRYLTGYWPANHVVRGLFIAVLPTDPERAPAFTISQFEEHWARAGSAFQDVRPIQMWVEMEDLADVEAGTTVERPKPVQFDRKAVLTQIVDVFTSRGIRSGTIGYERSMAPAGVREELEAALPGFDFVDAGPLFYELRSIKTEAEIAALRVATELAETGLRRVILDQDPRGKTVSQLRAEYDIAVRQAVAADPTCRGFEVARVYISTGGSVGPNVGRNDDVVTDGDVLWIDCGVQVDGYASDIGRTFSVGEPNATVGRIADALAAGSEAGLELIHAGTPMSAVHERMQSAVRKHGLPTYTRGHVGHAVGVAIGEQPPYLAPNETRSLEPGMVLAFERPFYVRGLGGFQFEENIVITSGGAEILTHLARGLQTI